MGSGVRIDLLSEIMNSVRSGIDDEVPIGLYPIWEAQGREVDCINTTDKTLRYTGTAPGGLQWEFKKDVKLNLASVDGAYQGTLFGGFVNTDYGFRIYTDPNPGADANLKTFNVFPSKIVSDPDNTSASDLYVIPVTTDTNIEYAGPSN